VPGGHTAICVREQHRQNLIVTSLRSGDGTKGSVMASIAFRDEGGDGLLTASLSLGNSAQDSIVANMAFENCLIAEGLSLNDGG
jgi:hypothetical protein